MHYCQIDTRLTSFWITNREYFINILFFHLFIRFELLVKVIWMAWFIFASLISTTFCDLDFPAELISLGNKCHVICNGNILPSSNLCLVSIQKQMWIAKQMHSESYPPTHEPKYGHNWMIFFENSIKMPTFIKWMLRNSKHSLTFLNRNHIPYYCF